MDKELIEKIAPWLYDIWQEAKSSMPDNWDGVTYESLSERDKDEYRKSAQRLIDLIKEAGYVSQEEFQKQKQEMWEEIVGRPIMISEGTKKCEDFKHKWGIE
jgi:hypothetical protein